MQEILNFIEIGKPLSSLYSNLKEMSCQLTPQQTCCTIVGSSLVTPGELSFPRERNSGLCTLSHQNNLQLCHGLFREIKPLGSYICNRRFDITKLWELIKWFPFCHYFHIFCWAVKSASRQLGRKDGGKARRSMTNWNPQSKLQSMLVSYRLQAPSSMIQVTYRMRQYPS